MISAIVAKAGNIIGHNGSMPWKLRGDLQYFKKTTMGKPIIMGANTFKSLNNRPLPGRLNIVLSRSKYIASDINNHLVVVSSLDGAFNVASPWTNEIIVIGGGQIYAEALPHLDKLYITDIHTTIQVDQSKRSEYTFFPIDEHSNNWEEIGRVKNLAAAGDDFNYDFVEYIRCK